ncbi:MAG TPA: hypothetical protein VIQ54_03255 [Polyangia bacterium]|jgi:hypothetical protein
MKPRLRILLAAFLLGGCGSDKLGGGTGGTSGAGGSGGTSAGGSGGTMSSGGSGGGGSGGTTAGGGTGGRPSGVMCTYPESSRCPGQCGNGVRNPCYVSLGLGIDCSNSFVEWCDGADLGTATCASRGLGTGTLRCTSDCGFDTSGCSGGSGGAAGTGGGGSGGTTAACDAIAGAGGTGGVAAGCDLEVARQALLAAGIGTVGAASTSTTMLPATLTDAQWSVKSEACRAGGYDLAPVAGTNVCLVSQVFTGTCQGNPARVWVLMSNGAVQCIYLALCPGSRIAPGVYSAVDSLCGS